MAFTIDPKDLLPDFKQAVLQNTTEITHQLAVLTQNPTSTSASKEVHRLSHSIKSAAALMQIDTIATLAGEVEDQFFDMQTQQQPVAPDMLQRTNTAIAAIVQCIHEL